VVECRCVFSCLYHASSANAHLRGAAADPWPMTGWTLGMRRWDWWAGNHDAKLPDEACYLLCPVRRGIMGILASARQASLL